MVASTVAGPLSGTRILDLTHVWAGPLAVRTLGDLGATVVKVERSHARGLRGQPATPVGGWLGDPDQNDHWNRNGVYIKLQRNRFGLALDYKSEAGRAVLLELVACADVIVENFSAQAMNAMGLSYEELSAANPAIIYVTMPGYGSTGPYSNRVAFGTVIESMSALTSMTGYSAEEPCNSAQALPDAMGGVHTVAAITNALARRKLTGRGERVEISLHEAGVTVSGPWLVAEQLKEQPRPIGNSHPQMAPHGIYPCKGKDNWLAMACEDDVQWQSLCGLLDNQHGEQSAWNLQARQGAAQQIDAQITDWTSERTKEDAAETLQAHGVPAGPVNNAPDMLADKQLIARGFYSWRDRFDVPLQGNPIHNSSGTPDKNAAPSQHWLPSPHLGEHNHEVLKSWLNYDDSRIAELEAAGTITTTPPE